MDLEKLRENYGQDCLGQVIRILSDRELIINVSNKHLSTGDKIIIYTAGEEIFDLNGDSLGLYENLKDILEVTHVTESYAICKKIIEETYSPFNPLSAFSPKTRERSVPFTVEENDIKPLKKTFSNVIKIGDLAKKA
ncbi:hypothetical protein [uncultured Thomasclavelia sp.]|uniref:hypothetical protein n=1 Tax=uncultured Thomasclavelia sp. TaxID=3025759 RepID=UPI00261B2569|nr:hypothetical protein [uncultured Thomasclavelia sp.]